MMITRPKDHRGSTALCRASNHLRRAETALAAALIAVIFLLLSANVVSRTIGRPLIWTDELAVHLMVWIAFLGASIGIASRGHMAIGLLPERLSPRARHVLQIATNAAVLAFMLVMTFLVWLWFDLPGLLRAGSGAALASQTFNFVYTDPTLTLGVRKIWFWMILPLTCATGTLHALAALAQSLRGRV